MDKVIVKKKNESFLSIEADSGIQMELAEHFSFYVPGYKFMPAYRNKIWDGKIRLFDLRQKTLYTGLFQYIDEFCKARDYELEVEGSKFFGRPDTIQDISDLDDFLTTLNITTNGEQIEPRDYQLEALKNFLLTRNRLLLSPTASGKSLIIYLAIRYYLNKFNDSSKVVLVVPTTSLVEQMYGDFADYSEYDDGFDAQKTCHKIYSGKEKYNIDQRIIITTWQSVHKLPTQWFSHFGMVIGDEAHSFKAKSLTSVVEKCVNASYRLGTTGTLDGSQTNQLVLEGLFGSVYKVTTTKELMDNNSLAKLKINMLILKYEDEICKAMKKASYQEEVDFIVRHDKRNKLITNLALDQEGNTLILFQYVEKHGKVLYEMLKSKCNNPDIIHYVSGETDVAVREEIRAITEKSNGAIIVASLGTMSTGINIRKLNNIIFASPSKSQIKVLQSIGRGLRKSPDGKDTILYDFADDLHWKNRKNYTLNHAAERLKIYSKEKFDYNIYEIGV